MNTQKKGMTGKDIITVGIFSAIYFVINFAFMLLSGLHPLLWILMPGLIAVFAGIPFENSAHASAANAPDDYRSGKIQWSSH